MLGLCRTKTLKVLEAHMAQQLTNIRLDLRKLENGAALHCRSHECAKGSHFWDAIWISHQPRIAGMKCSHCGQERNNEGSILKEGDPFNAK